MCGFIGFFDPKGLDKNESLFLLDKLSKKIIHRGPNSYGKWIDANSGIAFAHRRLAVLDISNNGNQPMVSNSNRFIIVFNGEIYNHISLREKLRREYGYKDWRGNSDTETLLASFEFYGIEKTLNICRGMFSFCLWDLKRKILILCRDRFGEKPLYYGWNNGTFIFGSELKAIKQHPKFVNKIRRESIDDQLRLKYIPSPYSIYENIYKLKPGNLIKVSLENPYKEIENINYWDFKDNIYKSKLNEIDLADEEILSMLEEKLFEVIKLQMISDVNIGSFLSGGIDSSLITALMQSSSNKPIKTFSIGFEEDSYNEAAKAKEISSYLGTDHTEMYLNSNDALKIIPEIPYIYDEPFSDASQIPTIALCKLAKQKVTVALSGDGGDELFAGYSRYLLVDKLLDKSNFIPIKLKKFASKILSLINNSIWDQSLDLLNINDGSYKINKLISFLNKNTFDEMYYSLLNNWSTINNLVFGIDKKNKRNLLNQYSFLDNYVQKMMAIDSTGYLIDDIMVKVDRASMSTSLETRAPFLDHELTNLVWRFPFKKKIKQGNTKWILKEILKRYLPEKIIIKKKKGFTLPISNWLKNDLKDWAESQLNITRLKNEGYLNPYIINKVWEEHKKGNNCYQYDLWNVLMFQSWLENN
tara:strand:+ start:1203 stop:3131 length:1929 start_codon:yes stop_codon:yes gene_type:complete